ncbi:MAG: hypothetical protein LC792_23350, partial [Actinobacteria bacterium]|nr:hypothetical protein [Actinomycetota bacterium]
LAVLSRMSTGSDADAYLEQAVRILETIGRTDLIEALRSPTTTIGDLIRASYDRQGKRAYRPDHRHL